MRAKHRRHIDEVVKIEEVVPKLVSPEPVVEEVRGVESEEGEDERTEGEESAEEDGGSEVPVEGRQVRKNRWKRENMRADKEKLREQDEEFEAQVDEYQNELMSKRQADKEGNLSQKVAGEGDEWIKPKALTSPMRVTAEERTLHDLTHIHHKPCCKDCVWARARNMSHSGKLEESEGGVPRVSMDYRFMGKDDEKARENPMLVVVNENTKEKCVRLIGKKGMGEGGEMD